MAPSTCVPIELPVLLAYLNGGVIYCPAKPIEPGWDLPPAQWERVRLLWPAFTGTVAELVETIANM